MKKIISMLLALMMILSLATVAFAADGDEPETTYTLTLNDALEGHTYTAYQIFAGDLSGDTLSNIIWGSGVTEAGKTTLGNAAAKAETLKTAENAAAFAKEVAPYLGTAAGSATVAAGATSCQITDLEAGYYLVQTTATSETNGAYTSYIMKVVKDTQANVKADVPEVQKKVKDTNDTTGETTDWQDSADYDIGDAVPFQLKATLPNNVTSYTSYKVVFHDTQSAGLTFNADSVEVYVDNKPVESGYTVVTAPTDGCTFEVVITDAKTLGATDSSVITVEYTATLNENAKIGAEGNPNEVYLEYSNNPNWKPDTGENEDDSPTGKTPEDKVIVFTFKVIVNKVDQDNNALKGAGFTLYKKNASGEYVAVGTEVKGTDLTTFEWKGLDDGDYKLVETTTPAGYNTMADIEFTITATHEEKSDDPALTSLTTTFEKASVDKDAGTITGTVVNQSGTELPSTGGMGTTLFYVFGGVLVLAAVVLLVTKKRMRTAE